MAIGNVLVVDDEPDWQGVFERNSHPENEGIVKTVDSLDEAASAIEMMAFAVAFVDVRLDERDDQNTDGLKVLELLRRSRDHTSAVMLTSYGTVGITRDALKEFDAYEAMDKAEVDPDKIEALVARGTSDCNNATRVEGVAAADVLRGRRPVMEWDSEMLEVTGAKGGVEGLYSLLETLAGPFLPLVYGVEPDLMKKHDAPSLAIGTFWSRAIAQALVVAIGEEEKLTAALDGDMLAARVGEPVGETLKHREKAGLAGIVKTLPSRDRSSFI
jgi:ActR/RegA family two-component response regulator